MLYWIFDLDHTLYHLPLNTELRYELLGRDDQLNYLLSMLPLEKIIFTNGTYGHAKKCLANIGITNNFKKIISRDRIMALKPDYQSYIKLLNTCKIKKNDLCVFFDDMPENLIAAKEFGRTTILISKSNYVHNNIDFWFTNIYLAINFFVSQINKNKNKNKNSHLTTRLPGRYEE